MKRRFGKIGRDKKKIKTSAPQKKNWVNEAFLMIPNIFWRKKYSKKQLKFFLTNLPTQLQNENVILFLEQAMPLLTKKKFSVANETLHTKRSDLKQNKSKYEYHVR